MTLLSFSGQLRTLLLVKQREWEPNHTPLRSAEVKNVFKTQFLIKHDKKRYLLLCTVQKFQPFHQKGIRGSLPGNKTAGAKAYQHEALDPVLATLCDVTDN